MVKFNVFLKLNYERFNVNYEKLERFSHNVSQNKYFVIVSIKFVIVREKKNIKFLAFNIKFVIVRAFSPRIMRALEDRHACFFPHVQKINVALPN